MKYRHQLSIFLVPYLLGSLLLVVIPAIMTVAVAFTEYNALTTPIWVGLENFERLWTSTLVRISIRNSLIFILIAVPMRLVGAMGLALLLQYKQRFIGFFRVIVYLPTIIPEVAYALVWLWIFNPLFGPLNLTLGWLGLPRPDWLAEPECAILAFVLMMTFQIGEGFVVLLAGLQNIPRSYYESAVVDGANSWQSFWRITIPLLIPILSLLTFRDMIVALQSTFTPSFVMTYGGPYYATTFTPLLVYELAFDFFDFGLAAAALVVNYILFGILIIGILNLVEGLKLDEILV